MTSTFPARTQNARLTGQRNSMRGQDGDRDLPWKQQGRLAGQDAQRIVVDDIVTPRDSIKPERQIHDIQPVPSTKAFAKLKVRGHTQ